jgi:hypothetical protein
MNRIYLLRLVDCEAPECNGVHPFYEELTECLDEKDQEYIGFTDDDDLFIRLDEYKVEKVERVFKKYFIFSKTDVTDKVISGEIQKLYPEVEKFTPKLFENFRLDNTTIDDILDKINDKGIESLDDIDKKVLSK